MSHSSGRLTDMMYPVFSARFRSSVSFSKTQRGHHAGMRRHTTAVMTLTAILLMASQLPAGAQTETQPSLVAPAIGRPHCNQIGESRSALVIGNRAYIHTAPLANPINDSADVAAALADLCFEVTLLNDVDRATFDRGLRDFRREVVQVDLALVFYAGHGIEVGGRNYLVPVDAELERDVDAEWEAVDLDQVLRATATAMRQVVILDACRNNPLARSMQRSVMSRGCLRLACRGEKIHENVCRYDGHVPIHELWRARRATAAIRRILGVSGIRGTCGASNASNETRRS